MQKTNVVKQDCCLAAMMLVIFQSVTLVGRFPGVPIKVPAKPQICFCESWHPHQEGMKEDRVNNAEQKGGFVFHI